VTIERAITVQTSGRYLVQFPDHSGPAPLLVGLHGYAEDAEAMLERLRSIPEVGEWLLVSIQGLHRFYRGRTEEVVASWMTRQNRERLIEDNISYVAAVVAAVRRERPVGGLLMFAGFSQGVAMAFRSAAHFSGTRPQLTTVRESADAEREGSAALETLRVSVIALGGDVPPELDRESLSAVEATLLGRGKRDQWYTEAKWLSDTARLQAAGQNVETFEFDGGHEWAPAFSRMVGTFLKRQLNVVRTPGRDRR